MIRIKETKLVFRTIALLCPLVFLSFQCDSLDKVQKAEAELNTLLATVGVLDPSLLGGIGTNTGTNTGTDTGTDTGTETGTDGETASVSGTVSYELPEYTSANGLNLGSPTLTTKAIRQAVVQVLNATDDTVLGVGNSGDDGTYSVEYTPGSATAVKVRVLARTDANTANSEYISDDTTNNILISVLDNASAGAQWAMAGSDQDIQSGSTLTSVDLTAEVSTRAAAPFAILDTAVSGYNLLEEGDSGITFTKLNMYWSPSNVPSCGDKALGQICTSHWGSDHLNSGDKALYILGEADSDTDEYDIPVVGHEFGHYTEDTLFRSESIGGSHSGSNELDLTVAFGEGFGTAFGAMILNSPIYFDTYSTNNTGNFNNDLEDNSATSNPGIFNESSVYRVLWDIYDDAADSNNSKTDNLSLGYAAIYETLRNQQRSTGSLTTILSFIKGLKDNNPSSSSAIDDLTTMEYMQSITSEFGVAGDTSGVACRNDSYTQVSSFPFNEPSGSTDLGYGGGGYNKYCSTNYYYMTGDDNSYTFTLTPAAGCDLDFSLVETGETVATGWAFGEGAAESFTHTLTSGATYVAFLYTYSISGSDSTGTCSFTLTIN